MPSQQEPGRRDSDCAELARLLRRYRRALFAIALDRVGSHDAAEDIVQQATVAAWEHRADLRSIDRAAAWMREITLNCCRQWQRGEARRSRAEHLAGTHSEPPSSIFDELARREALRQIRAALRGIPASNRAALLLYVSGYSYGEIAAFLDLPLATVRGRIARTREQVRRHFLSGMESDLGRKEKQSHDLPRATRAT
jgi:RNA polymerase sigma-70 factor (ECF subfamily)